MRAKREKIGLCLIDVQEKLFPKIAGHAELLRELKIAIQAFQIMELPVISTEQYPQGLGSTVKPLQGLNVCEKSRFSAAEAIAKTAPEITQWVLIGIEAHVCVLQTALDLLEGGYEVIVPRGAIGSRTERDCAIAADEMRARGVRITALESLLFELLADAKAPEFKQISALIK